MKKAGWKSILIGLAAAALTLGGCAQAQGETGNAGRFPEGGTDRNGGGTGSRK